MPKEVIPKIPEDGEVGVLLGEGLKPGAKLDAVADPSLGGVQVSGLVSEVFDDIGKEVRYQPMLQVKGPRSELSLPYPGLPLVPALQVIGGWLLYCRDCSLAILRSSLRFAAAAILGPWF